MPLLTSTDFIRETLNQYTPRAAQYDAASGGRHGELARDIVKWLRPPRGGAVLDLACGTGLVTFAMAEAVGPNGVVFGVDITEAMLNEARRKAGSKDSANIEWVLGDITQLGSVDAVRDMVDRRGGFDVISCCSALVLLQDPGHEIKHWATLLKPGTGKMIIDVPTEDHTLQYLFTGPVRQAVGKSYVFHRALVTDLHSLEKLYEDAGLEVQASWRTRSYLPERWWRADEMMTAFDDCTSKIYRGLEEDPDVLNKAREAWPRLWNDSLNEDGMLWDGHALYVSIGRRKISSAERLISQSASNCAIRR